MAVSCSSFLPLRRAFAQSDLTFASSTSIFFHAFAASVAQSSIVIKSPNSVLAPHAWAQLAIAIDVFETASTGGAPVSMFVPRLKSLRDTAFLSLQNAQSVPRGLATSQVSDFLAEGTDANLSILVSRLDSALRMFAHTSIHY